jgi:hypothetical protein
VREYLQKEVLLIAMVFLAKRQTSAYGSLGSFILLPIYVIALSKYGTCIL